MNRSLPLAVAASLALHGLVLVAAAGLPPPEERQAGKAIDFELVEGAIVRPEPEPVAAAPAPAPARQRSVRPAPPAPPPAPRVEAQGEPPAPRAAPAAPSPPAPGPPAAGALAAGDVLPADVGGGIPVAVATTAVWGSLTGGEGAAGGLGAGGPGAGGPGIRPGGGGSPHGALLARLRSRTAGCYPRAAVRRRVEGVVRVSFCVGEGGAPRDLRLDRSSGSRLLDDAALDCVVRGAAPLPGAGACVTVPVDFHLRR